jgi:DNA-binding transcriptional LysR family regulator
MPNPIVVIVASDDALARRRKVTLQDLAEHRFILREPGSGTRMAADQFFRAEKFHPNIRLELGSNEAVKESVAGGLGIGVVSRHALHGHQKEHGVVSSMWPVFRCPRPGTSSIRPAKNSPLAAAFKQHVLSSIADHA